jgi:hypothetical protein
MLRIFEVVIGVSALHLPKEVDFANKHRLREKMAKGQCKVYRGFLMSQLGMTLNRQKQN